MSQVRSHTRRQANGKTVTVRRHTRTDEEQAAVDQRRRDTFERRVLRERQQAANPGAYQQARTPGERRPRKAKGPTPAKARRHAKKAFRLWRRHKARASGHAALAAGILGAWAAHRGSRWAWRKSARLRGAIRARLARRKNG